MFYITIQSCHRVVHIQSKTISFKEKFQKFQLSYLPNSSKSYCAWSKSKPVAHYSLNMNHPVIVEKSIHLNKHFAQRIFTLIIILFDRKIRWFLPFILQFQFHLPAFWFNWDLKCMAIFWIASLMLIKTKSSVRTKNCELKKSLDFHAL